MLKSLTALAVALTVSATLVSCRAAANPIEDRTAEKVEACVQLHPLVKAIYDMRFRDVEPEVAWDVVVERDELSDYQRWVLGSYLVAVYTEGVKLDATTYWGDFLGVCVNIMGKGTLELTPTTGSPAVNVSRRDV